MIKKSNVIIALLPFLVILLVKVIGEFPDKDEGNSYNLCTQNAIQSLYMHQPGMLIKAIFIDNNGDTTESRLRNVQWAQLRLYPTIGCARPTLFYLADNDQQVKRIEVNDAVVIDKNNY